MYKNKSNVNNHNITKTTGGYLKKMAPSAQKMTTKNLQEVSELLDSLDLGYKKCVFYSTQAKDPELKEKLGKYANNYKQCFNAMFNYLNSH